MPEYNLTEQRIESIRKYFTRQEKIERLIIEAGKKNKTELDRIVNLINQILTKHGISEQINSKQIRFKPSYVDNLEPVKDKKFSEIIFNEIYPIPTRKVFSHYTNFDSGKSILSKGKFWLFNLLKNFEYDEYKHFYEIHGITGYRDERFVFGVPIGYKPQMAEIFSLSLTTEENNSPVLWKHFAKDSTGLKLTFEVQSKIPDFREVYYSNRDLDQPIPLLKDLFSEVETESGYPLNFTYMSKIGAFYIKGYFDNEQEFRFLIKRNSDTYNAFRLKPKKWAEEIAYIELPFKSKFANFRLLKVERGTNCDNAKFEMLARMIHRKYGNEIEIIR